MTPAVRVERMRRANRRRLLSAETCEPLPSVPRPPLRDPLPLYDGHGVARVWTAGYAPLSPPLDSSWLLTFRDLDASGDLPRPEGLRSILRRWGLWP